MASMSESSDTGESRTLRSIEAAIAGHNDLESAVRAAQVVSARRTFVMHLGGVVQGGVVAWSIAAAIEHDLPIWPAVVLAVVFLFGAALAYLWVEPKARWESNVRTLRDNALIMLLSAIFSLLVAVVVGMTLR